ncbi:MAG: ABC transporter permease [Armatimonadetes bacterium]|nr:ABC transporter permease [Armatimonadota bacterium]
MTEVVDILRFAAPIGLAATGETIGQKAGVLNVGLEGMMLAGSYAAVIASGASGNPWLGFGAGMVAGAALGLVQALFTLKLAADQVVAGTAVNLLAMGLTSALFRLQFGTSGKLLSVPTLPKFAGGLDLVLIGGLLAAAAGAWVLAKTKFGLALRACGEYPSAAQAAGFSVTKIRLIAALAGAIAAGAAGAYLSLGISGSFAENMTAGRGFIALAMVTFGRWRPVWVAVATLFVGAADWAQFSVWAQNPALPPQAWRALPYVLALVVLVCAGRGVAAPAALAAPFQEEA